MTQWFVWKFVTLCMRIDVITLFPQLIHHYLQYGVLSRGINSRVLVVNTWDPREFTNDRHRTVDDRPYGGGPGMVMKYQPLKETVDAIKSQVDNQSTHVVYLTPKGDRLTQNKIRQLSMMGHLILLSARYEGIDQRVIDSCVDEELSLGDYILTGGELAVLAVIDAIGRLLPGVLGSQDSAGNDSFSDGLLEYPHYTRPEEVDGMKVPEVLLQGNHQVIEAWRRKQSLLLTKKKRPDLFAKCNLSEDDRRLLSELSVDND